uniref:Uncharacterized protein n=1 Tax=Magallana gigas TaxID=29159 RepID=A0A8W8MST3_MAGGI
MQTLDNNNVKLAQAMAHQDHHLSSFISTVDKRFNNVMSAVQKNHQDAIALSILAHRSMDAVEHEFVILSELIFRQTNVTAQLEKELEHVKLGIPLKSLSDGSCLFSSCSIAMTGDNRFVTELRVRTYVETVTNHEIYKATPNAPDFLDTSPSFDKSSLDCATPH